MRITIEIDEKTVSKIDLFSANRNDYFRKALEEKLMRDEKNKSSYEEKVQRTIESYKKFPQQPEEYGIWLDEQVWED